MADANQGSLMQVDFPDGRLGVVGREAFELARRADEPVIVSVDGQSWRVDSRWLEPVDASTLRSRHPLPDMPGASGERVVVPVVAETAQVRTETVVSGVVRVHKTTREHVEEVKLPLAREVVDVQRVSVERFVDRAPGVRFEQDVMIVPVIEEVLVVEKRLMVREELHIRKTRRVEDSAQDVTWRSEEVRIERTSPDNTPRQQHPHPGRSTD